MNLSVTKAKNSPLFKPALLSLSLLTILTGVVIVPTLGSIAEAFPEVSSTQVQLVLTLPSIFIMAVNLLTGRLASIFPKRTLLLAATGLYVISGVGGSFSTSIFMLLIARALFGISVGLIAPLSVSIIADFYRGEERAKMVGFAHAAQSLSGIVFAPLVGVLAISNWRNVFWVYALAVPVFLVVLFILPEPEREASEKVQKEIQDQRLPKAALLLAGLMFLQRIAFYVMPTNLSMYLVEKQIGGSGLSGIAISFSSLASFVVGLLFAWLFKRLGNWLGAVSLMLLGLGHLCLSMAQAPFLIYLALLLIGFGEGLLLPLLLYQAAQAVSAAQRTTAIALMSSARFLAQFSTPYALKIIAAVTGNPSFEMKFAATSGLLMLAVLIQGLILVRRKKIAVSV